MNDARQEPKLELSPEQVAMLRKLTASQLPTAEEVRGIIPMPDQPTLADEPEHPAPVISESLVERAPAEMPQIVRSMHHTAAQALEDAALMLEHEMQSHVQLMRDEANQLRSQGDSQAITIEALSVLIHDAHSTFKIQAEKLSRFRAAQPENGNGNR